MLLIVAVLDVVLAYLTNEAPVRRRDARLVLDLARLRRECGFLGLHALATPSVLLSHRTWLRGGDAGPVLPCRRLVAAAALPSGGPRARSSCVRRAACGSGWSCSCLPGPSRRCCGCRRSAREMAPLEVVEPLRIASIVAVALYAFAAWHFLRLYWYRGRPLLLAIVVAVILLAEAMITVAFSRDWHLSWWEWHLLMALGFGAVALGARVEYRREGSLTGVFGGLYLSSTLDRLDRWHADALSDLATASAEGRSSGAVLQRLRMDGATTEELALLERAGDELHRADELLRAYLPQQFVAQARTDPGQARVGSGEEREITVLFADLAGYTSFSERHAPTEVVEPSNGMDGIGPDHQRLGMA